MRVKTETRRQHILNKAREVFHELGYERASMSEIAARVGGSKATLYGYFSTKDELFAAVMRNAPEVGGLFDALSDPALVITSPQHFREIIERFAVSYLNVSLSADLLTARRNLIAQSERSNVGKLWFEAGPAKSLLLLSQFLERGMREKCLRPAEPWLAMLHLIALTESEFMMRRLLGLVEAPPPEEIRAAALRGVDVYLRAYAPE